MGIAHSVIRFQVVDVLAKDERPKVLAEELDDVERIVEAWAIPREPVFPALLAADYSNMRIRATFPRDPVLHDIRWSRVCSAPRQGSHRLRLYSATLS